MGNATLFRTRRSNLNASLPRRRASALPFTASRNCFTAKTAMKKALTGRAKYTKRTSVQGIDRMRAFERITRFTLRDAICEVATSTTK